MFDFRWGLKPFVITVNSDETVSDKDIFSSIFWLQLYEYVRNYINFIMILAILMFCFHIWDFKEEVEKEINFQYFLVWKSILFNIFSIIVFLLNFSTTTSIERMRNHNHTFFSVQGLPGILKVLYYPFFEENVEFN